MSVMGSTFIRYKTRAIVNLDFTPTLTGPSTPQGFRARSGGRSSVQRAAADPALTHQVVVEMIGAGYGDQDFMRLLTTEPEGDRPRPLARKHRCHRLPELGGPFSTIRSWPLPS